MLQRTLCVTVISVVVVFSTCEDTVLNTCRTPNQEPGVCVLITSCQALLRHLYPERRTPESIQYVTDSHCGYEGETSVVCCPFNTSEPTKAPKPSNSTHREQTEMTEPLIDVSKSPRTRMLPLSICGTDAGERILNGNESGLMEYPWMALLGDESTRSRSVFPCAGTVITNRYVLTAAHCVAQKTAAQKPTLVRLGELNLRNETDCATPPQKLCAPPVEEYQIEDIVIHPNYSKPIEFDNDIALIRLNQTITFKDHIRPICLPIGPEQRKKFRTDDTVIVAGWGLTEDGFSSAHLMKAFLPVVPSQKCAESYSETKYRISSSRQLCAGGDGKSDACSGDSGGPFKAYGEVPDLEDVPEGGTPGTVQRIVQYGIVSFGPRLCTKTIIPGVYTKIGFFMDWILNNIRE